MADDNRLQILIEILTKELGPEKADQVMRKYTDQVKKTNVEVDKSTLKHGELKKAVHLLGHQFGEAGRAASFFFNSTLIGGAALAALIVGKMVEAWKKWGDAIDGVATVAAMRIGDMKTAMHELAVERAKADEAFKKAEENVDAAHNISIGRINDEKAAVLELADAREKYELSQAKSDEDKAAISGRYAGLKQGIGKASLASEIAANEERIARLQQLATTRGTQAAAQAGGLTPEQAVLQLRNLKQVQKDLLTQAEQMDKYAAEAKPGFWLNVSKHMSSWGRSAVTQMEEASERSEATAYRLRSQAGLEQRREVPLTAAVTGDQAVLDMLKRVEQLKAENSALRERSKLSGMVGVETGAVARGQGPRAAMLLDAAAGADAIRAGGRASPTEAQAINAATRALGMEGQTSATILRILSALNDKQDAFALALKEVEARSIANVGNLRRL